MPISHHILEEYQRSELSPSRGLQQNPNPPYQNGTQQYNMDMFDRNLRQHPDHFDSRFNSEPSDFFSNFLRAAAEKRNAAAGMADNDQYRDPRVHFEDPAIMSARVSSPPNTMDLSEKGDPRAWMNMRLQGGNPLHRLRGYDADFNLNNGELGPQFSQNMHHASSHFRTTQHH
ncbi:hypothetical protein K493DRAFT_334667 [Basidiobolus meristosporus CBS 931.73]|uniref:Uncharacterized protein n=1 Tax=Basidiobolus meristosporus CBS 931.73 TaxID=1314790 RepID=A0A1Y1YWB3_9FUNG|nr:hypothetical protein K493DRAFT_334667 [Basidiobolus meristosporus CBS 931.73]|eukprot:ORY02330.1 hypothetical protein K493DRAFT_334667 [Basidiobolus meristosporus CBS 931.73]